MREQLIRLGGIWDDLSGEVAGGASPGPRARGSRPPIKVSVVSLVMEITVAAREGAEDLAHRWTPDSIHNLWLIHGALLARPDDDLITWWSDAVEEWANRGDAILQPHLLERLYGAKCPTCGNVSANAYQDGEWVKVPAIEVGWDEDSIRVIVCRQCGCRWDREDNLSELINVMIANNRHEVLHIT
jgi:hypothetical protein